ncbi:MAG TPA: ABC transporter permease [Gemmatimonadaceae bacterium]|nr:ABC transporter permease [Gemmatimonadaceae bacterium]
MSVAAAFAIAGADWRAATSYRVATVLSVAGLLVSIVPMYYIANALQPVIGGAIASEGDRYFPFLLVGMVTFSLLTAAVTALPTALRSGIATGTLEAMLATPTPVAALLAGFTGQRLAWAALRGAVLLVAGWALGAHFAWARVGMAAAIMALIVLAHVPFGLMASALVLAFRTTGPLPQAVLLVSGLLGGVYYPTQVIPSWFRDLSAFVPLSYGLRALRRTLLEGATAADVAVDLAALAAFAAALLALGGLVFAAALRYARRAGSLAQY